MQQAYLNMKKDLSSKLNMNIFHLSIVILIVLDSFRERFMETNLNFQSSFRCGAVNIVAS